MSDNESVDGIVLGGIDQFLPQRPMEKQFLTSVNELVRDAISNKDIKGLERIGASIIGINQVTGIAFSEFIYTVDACWKEIGYKMDFYDWVEERFGKVKKTTQDHQRIWSMFVSGDLPKEFVEKFKTKSIRVLIPVANLWNQGYEVTDSQWKQLADAPDPTTMRKIIKKIKGKEDRGGTLRMEWIQDQDAIVGWVDGKPHTIYLTCDKDDPIIVKMLGRLFGDGRVLEK